MKRLMVLAVAAGLMGSAGFAQDHRDPAIGIYLGGKTEIQTAFQCGAKRYCKQMKSCREACYYFIKCGLRRLDRDRDGIPCENVCSRPCGRRG